MEAISAYIDACGSISGEATDRAPAESLQIIRSVTLAKIPATYRVPPAAVLPNPGTGIFPADHERGIWHELVQHLHDLRYLTEQNFLDYHKDKKKVLANKTRLYPVLAAVRTYLGEESWSGEESVVPEGAAITLRSLNRNLTTITERISRYTTWDGSLPMPEVRENARLDCYHRSLAYRLRVLNTSDFRFAEEDLLSDDNVEQLFTFAKTVLNINNSRAKKNFLGMSKRLWNVLSNVDVLIKVYTKKGLFKHPVPVLYQVGSIGKIEDRLVTGAFVEPQDLKLAKSMRAGDKLVKKAAKVPFEGNDTLEIRLLQLKLWVLSYYVGAIDGVWGKLSHQALHAFILEEIARVKTENNKTRVKQQRNIVALLLPVDRRKGIFVADFKKIFDRLKNLTVMNYTVTTAEEKADELFAELRAQGVAEWQLDQRVLNEEGVSAAYAQVTVNVKRRVFVAKPSIISRIFSGIGRIVKWLKDGVFNLVERIVGPIFSFVKLIVRKVRMAISYYLEGFRYLSYFLLGKPLVSDLGEDKDKQAVIFATKFQLDFDAISIVPSNFRDGDAARHSRNLSRMLDGMGDFIDTTIWIIKAIGKLLNPGGWVWLGWQIGRFILELLTDGRIARKGEQRLKGKLPLA